MPQNSMTKEEYREAQSALLEEAMEGELRTIKVYPAQNRQLWFMPAEDRALCMIHRWIFFSDFISKQKPEDRCFSIYVYANLLNKAIKLGLAPHPKRDLLDYVEECLDKLVTLRVIDLLVLETGHKGVCIRSSMKRPASIIKGKERYELESAKNREQLKSHIELLDKCLKLST